MEQLGGDKDVTALKSLFPDFPVDEGIRAASKFTMTLCCTYPRRLSQQIVQVGRGSRGLEEAAFNLAAFCWTSASLLQGKS